MLDFSFDDDAIIEVEAATTRYRDEASESVAITFSLEIARAVKLLRQFPDMGTPSRSNSRRLLLAEFPFAVIYRVQAGQLRVVSIAHQRRRPGYWRRRT